MARRDAPRALLPFFAVLAGCPDSGDGGGADATGTSGANSSTTSDAVDFGPCARLLACVDALDNTPLTPFLADYGEDGACWDMFPKDACWQDCTAALAPLTGNCDEAAACCECQSDTDCADAPEMVCIANKCLESGATVGCQLAIEHCDLWKDELSGLEEQCASMRCGDEAEALTLCRLAGATADELDMSCELLEDCVGGTSACAGTCAEQSLEYRECVG